MTTPKKAKTNLSPFQRARKAYDSAKYRCKHKKSGYEDVKFALPDFETFVKALGLPKPGQSLDRIDAHGHYELGNVRWASKSIQALNKKGSKGASMPPLAVLIKQSEYTMQSYDDRAAASSGWMALIAFFAGAYLDSKHRSALKACCADNILKQNSFRTTDVVDLALDPGVFHLPALTDAHAVIRMRGGPFRRSIEPTMGNAQVAREAGQGVLKQLGRWELEWNLSKLEVEELKYDIADDKRAGACWVGRPTDSALLGGWLEGKMLACASRLHCLGRTSAMLPALVALELVAERFDQTSPLWSCDSLFIPDFQVDAGPYWRTSRAELYRLFSVLEHRIKEGKKTFLGVQSPGRLPTAVRQVLLSRLNVREFQDCMTPHPDRSDVRASARAKLLEWKLKAEQPLHHV